MRLAIFLIFLQRSLAYFYPPLFWHKDNCGFRRLQASKNDTKEFYMQVVPNNGMNVVCPNQVTINNWLSDAGISSPTLMENMWLVDKQGYDKCTVNQDHNWNKLVLLCDNPRKIKFKPFVFHPRFNMEEPRFSPGQHYYFISTSQGFKEELKTRKASGSEGSCEKYHMKLHIYVCNPKKEDCTWQMPHCNPPAELNREMLLIDGKLPAPTYKPTEKTLEEPTSEHPTHLSVKHNTGKAMAGKMCANKDKKGVSIHLILNFVLGGVALFMVVVIIILACGLTKKSKEYTLPAPQPTMSIEDPKTSIEPVRYTDIPVQFSPESSYSQYLILQQSTTTTKPQTYDGRVFLFPDIISQPSHNEIIPT